MTDRICNLTDRPLLFWPAKGEPFTVPPFGKTARINRRSTLDPKEDPENLPVQVHRHPIDIVEFLPPPQPGVIFIVYADVLEMCAGDGRTDVYGVGTGNDYRFPYARPRDASSGPLHVHGLVAAPQ